MGIASGNTNRKHLMVGSLMLTSFMTILTGKFHSFGVLVLMRFLSGITMSAIYPTTFSLASDYFPPRMRTTANGIVAAGPYIGIGLSSMSIVLISRIGWRYTMMSMGAFGILIASACQLLMKVPQRSVVTEIEKEKLPEKEDLLS